MRRVRLQSDFLGRTVEHFLCDIGLLFATLGGEFVALEDLVKLTCAADDSEEEESTRE